MHYCLRPVSVTSVRNHHATISYNFRTQAMAVPLLCAVVYLQYGDISRATVLPVEVLETNAFLRRPYFIEVIFTP